MLNKNWISRYNLPLGEIIWPPHGRRSRPGWACLGNMSRDQWRSTSLKRENISDISVTKFST